MRLLFQIISQFVLAAIALLVVHFTLPDVEITLAGFFIAVGVFVLAHAILGPFVLNMAQRYAAPLAGGVGLVATLLSLWIATLFPDGISISGVQSWVLAPVIVWVITALGGWIVMALIIDKWLGRRSARRAIEQASS